MIWQSHITSVNALNSLAKFPLTNLTMIIFNVIQKANSLFRIQIPEHTPKELL